MCVTIHRRIAKGLPRCRSIDAVQRRIQSGVFQPSDRIPSDTELVEEFRVSRPTVAKALRELERRGRVTRRPGSATYVQNLNGSSRRFGFPIPGLGDSEIFDPICGKMARVAQQDKHSLLWGSTADRVADAEDKREAALERCRQFVRQKVGGVLFAPLELMKVKDRINREIVESLTSAG